MVFKQKNSIFFFSISLIGLFLVSCENNEKTKKKFNEWYSQAIDMPSNNLIRHRGVTNVNPLAKKTKILTIINGDCGSCIDDLNFWKSFIKNIDTTKIGFIFLVHSNHSFSTFNYLDSLEINFNYPIFEDENKKYIKKNNFPKEKHYQTFLLDENNKIILIGNPMLNKKVEELYVREIQKRTK